MSIYATTTQFRASSLSRGNGTSPKTGTVSDAGGLTPQPFSTADGGAHRHGMADLVALGTEPLCPLSRPWQMDRDRGCGEALPRIVERRRDPERTACCRRLGSDDGGNDAADDIASARYLS